MEDMPQYEGVPILGIGWVCEHLASVRVSIVMGVGLLYVTECVHLGCAFPCCVWVDGGSFLWVCVSVFDLYVLTCVCVWRGGMERELEI